MEGRIDTGGHEGEGKKQQETNRNIGVSRNAHSETSQKWEYIFEVNSVDRGHCGDHGRGEWCADDATCTIFIMLGFLPPSPGKGKASLTQKNIFGIG